MTDPLSDKAVVTPFGDASGTAVHDIALRVPGARANVITWGAVLRDLVIETEGGPRRVVLGLDRIEDYVAHSPSLGAICGRCANRIKGSRFTLDGETHALAHRPGEVHLHGGPDGFDRRVWRIADASEQHVTLTLQSPDGDQGYPGALDALCRYTLVETADGPVLRVETRARMADGEAKASPVNLVHHSYFNLDGSKTVAGHRLQIEADFVLPVDAGSTPTGEIVRVDGGAYDFRDAREIGTAPLDANVVLRRSDGAYHALAGNALAPAATVEADGLAMDVWTSEPGLQVYNASHLDAPVTGLGGRALTPMAAICLEPQRFPDSINRPHFSNTVLRPGGVCEQRSEFRFHEVNS